ncbi:MAG: hypothetical protein L6R41_003023 [Letrouitia leprolyta]|nr:MAG: hypothetical protein L6R41_003023 [Letrouitia leprolyta]
MEENNSHFKTITTSLTEVEAAHRFRRGRTDYDVGKSDVLTVDYGALSPSGHKTYHVPQRPVQENVTLPGIHQPSRSINAERPYARLHRRPRGIARPRPAVSPDAALLRRKNIYARGLYSLHVGTNRLSRFRDLNPQLFVQDEELIGRARKWIRRELQVFDFLNIDGGEEEGVARRMSNAEFLLEYIMAILKTVDIKGSGGQAEDMLQEFLGREHTRLFLHELRAWLRSPYASLDDWDRHVQYAEHETPNGGSEPNLHKRAAATDSRQTHSTTFSTPRRSPQCLSLKEHTKGDRHTPYPNRSAVSYSRRHNLNYDND